MSGQPKLLDRNGQKDALEFYLKEARRFKILTPEEETMLGEQCQAQITKSKAIPGSPIEARDKLVRHNLRWVITIANQYNTILKSPSISDAMTLIDLIQEGNIGLITAAERFNPAMGRFTTYATWWIHQSIGRALDNCGATIRKPVHRMQTHRKIWTAYIKLVEELNRKPTLDELSERMEMPLEDVRERYNEMLLMTESLEENWDNESEDDSYANLINSLPNHSDLRPDRLLEIKEEIHFTIKKINKVFKSLIFYSEREKNIFRQRYGLNKNLVKYTLEEVGQRYSVTRERIRQMVERVWYRSTGISYDKDENWLFKTLNRLRTFIEAANEPLAVNLIALPAVSPSLGRAHYQDLLDSDMEYPFSLSEPNMLLASLICSIYGVELNNTLYAETFDGKTSWVRSLIAYMLKAMLQVESKEIAQILGQRLSAHADLSLQEVVNRLNDQEVQKEITIIRSKFTVILSNAVPILFDYQTEALDKVTKAFETQDAVLMIMAPGLGKTVVSGYFAQNEIKQRKKGLFLCHENDILKQAFNQYRKILGHEAILKKYYGGEKNLSADDADVLFASFQSFKNSHTLFEAGHFDFIVVDESHHGQAPTYKEVIEYFTPEKLLGMTATPDRGDSQDIRDIFGEEVVNYSLEEALANNWITPVEYHIMSDNIDLKKLKMIAHQILHEHRPISLNQINKSIFIEARDEQIVQRMERYTRLKKTVVFCESIRHAEIFAKLLPEAVTFHSKNPGPINRKALHDFRVGQVQYILTVNKFNEGIDIPDAEVCIFLRSTESKTIFLQQLGRGLRKAPGKDKLVILDFAVNYERILTVHKLSKKIAELAEKRTYFKSGSSSYEGGLEKIHFKGEGFDFIFTDSELEILEVINQLKIKPYATWQEASASAQRLGIKKQKQYKRYYRIDSRLPGDPYYQYKDFPGWRIFLNKRDPSDYYPTLKEASDAAIGLGIIGQSDYVLKYQQDPRLPSDPRAYYQGFLGWELFLGKKPADGIYPTCKEASRAAIKLGIKSRDEYYLKEKRYKEDPRLPCNPHEYYSDFPRWSVFLGLVYPTWKHVALVAKVLGIESQREYFKNYHKVSKLPGDPTSFYDDFPGWAVFFGRPKQPIYETYERASAAAITLGITNAKQYYENYRLDSRLPSKPEDHYKEFQGFPEFLGQVRKRKRAVHCES